MSIKLHEVKNKDGKSITQSRKGSQNSGSKKNSNEEYDDEV